MTEKLPSSKNALQTGVYSRDTLLPWENAADHTKHCADIFADLFAGSQPKGEILIGIARDYAENRWIRGRTRRMTAIATSRHPFGKQLENSGARSWRDVLVAIRKYGAEDRKLLQSVAKSLNALTQAIQDLNEEDQAGDLQEIVKGCTEAWERLRHIEDAIDYAKEFFQEYSPKRLQKRILLENALDAQGEKILARFEIELERRKLRNLQNSAGKLPGEELQGDADEAVAASAAIVGLPPDDGHDGLNADDLDHDDEVDLDSDDNDDGLDEWGEPMNSESKGGEID